MADAHAADHPAKKEGAAHHAPAAKKASPVAKVWGLMGMVVGLGVGLIVLFTLGGSLFGMGIDSFGEAMQMVSNSLTNAGIAFGNFSISIRAWSSGISRVLLALVSALVLPLIVFMIGRMIVKEIKKGKDGAGH